MTSVTTIISYVEGKLRHWLLGRHPYNTIFNFNWVNVSPMIRYFRESQNIFKGRIADIACGGVPYYDLIAQNAELYIAIDYPSALPQNEKRRIERVAGDMKALPLASESIDAVLCTQALYQVPFPADVLGEIARILRPGGHAIISVPHISPIHSEPNDLYRFTPDGLSSLAETVGLQTSSVHVQGKLFSSFALCLAMNLVLTQIIPGQRMQLLPHRQLLFAPLIAFINGVAYILDLILPFNRTPVNFALVVVKK